MVSAEEINGVPSSVVQSPLTTEQAGSDEEDVLSEKNQMVYH